MSLVERYEAELQEFYERLAAVPAGLAALPYRAGGWTRKEVLGHLIDSALNNHVRFAGAATNPQFAMLFGYEEKGWVAVHGYREMPWADLLTHWRLQNELLARVIPHLPGEQALRVGPVEGLEADVWPVGEWAKDYLRHLRHHVDQITA